VARERNDYLIKAPGEERGDKEGIPVQSKVRNLKKRIEEKQWDRNY
jgi:hypothetical protein